MVNSHVARMSTRLDERISIVKTWDDRYAGNAPLTFLSPDSRKALGDRLHALSVNFCRLAVDSLVERLKVTGFVVNGKPDPLLWKQWREQGGPDELAKAITDSLVSGKGWLSVWGSAGVPSMAAEAPSTVIVETDPLTGKPVRGLKRWNASGRAHAVYYELDKVRVLRSASHVTEGNTIPADGWLVVSEVPNPLGLIPLFPLLNRGTTTDVHGVSEMSLIADLNDALTKVLVDAMVTSEDFAKPRRWATGLEVQEDEEGNAVDPFENVGPKKIYTSEDAATKFGQFDTSDLTSYNSLTDNLLSQISALSGLPAHYVFSKMSPSNGEEVRAKEISLVARAESKIQTLTLSVAQVAKAMVAVRDDSNPHNVSVEVVWADPATRTIAQEADSVSKLASGDRPILPMRQARQKLGYSLSEIAEMEKQDSAEAAMRLAVSL